MPSLIDAVSKILLEEIAVGTTDSLPKLDPFWNDVHTTWMGVTRSGIGRGWKVLHTFREGLSGAVRWVPAGGEDLHDNSALRLPVPGNPREFPSLDESVLPGYFQRVITLSELVANVFIPDEYLRADELTAAIASSVMEIIESHNKLANLAEIIPFMSSEVASGVPIPGYVATVTNNPTPSGSSCGTVIVTGGAIGLFHAGMSLDVWNSSYTTKRNLVELIVESTRYIPSSSDVGGYGQVVLKTKDGSAAPDLAAGDRIVLRDSVQSSSVAYGPASPEYWLANTGTVFGINLDVYTQMQSVVATGLNQALDSTLMDRLFSRFVKAYGIENCPDTCITSQGVKLAFVHTSPAIGSVQVFRNVNDRYIPHEGFDFDDMPYVFNGKPIRFRISQYFPSSTDFTSQSTSFGGRAWFMKTKDRNIVRYVPPRQPGTKTGLGLDSEAEFRFPYGGPNGVFWPVSSSAGRLTPWSQAPWTKRVAYAPKVLQGIKVTGLAEML